MYPLASYERVYVLRLARRKFYVGTTLREMRTRYAEHAEGWGSRWTTQHPPTKCLCWMRVPVGTSGKVENELTRYLMWTLGWGAVRGGDWVFVHCKHRNWLPLEVRSLGSRDVLPLHLRPMSHFRPETLRLIEAFEMRRGLKHPQHLNPDPFPEVTLGSLPDHLHHVDPAHAVPVTLRAQ